MNWTGVGIAFPSFRNGPEFGRPGVYILVSYQGADDDDLPTVYIGQGDGSKGRIDQHLTERISGIGGSRLPRPAAGSPEHTSPGWSTRSLIGLLRPSAPMWTTAMFRRSRRSPRRRRRTRLREILQILALVGLRVFEFPQPVATPKAKSEDPTTKPDALR
jgi:hypothetical protein